MPPQHIIECFQYLGKKGDMHSSPLQADGISCLSWNESTVEIVQDVIPGNSLLRIFFKTNTNQLAGSRHLKNGKYDKKGFPHRPP